MRLNKPHNKKSRTCLSPHHGVTKESQLSAFMYCKKSIHMEVWSMSMRPDYVDRHVRDA